MDLELLTLLKWPLIACLVLPWMLVYLGLHIVQRQIIFVDLALAQVAAFGTAVSIFLGYDVHDWQSYACSVGFTLAGAALFTFTRRERHRVPQEALIGIVYVVAAAAGILVLSQGAGGKEELQRSLVGELLVVSPGEVLRTLGLYLAIGAVHLVFRRQFAMISFHPEEAERSGMNVGLWDFGFYVLFGFVVTTFVHIGGVLMVFSYLIVPAVCAIYLVSSVGMRMLVGWATATVASLVSLYASTRFDLPIGATIVCGLGVVLVLVMITARFRERG